jgi:signal transduction histidine kinase/ligand-binding sensor domain-containing protein/CheY-like chemotaxis protein/AraC-like DNA-binding protein
MQHYSPINATYLRLFKQDIAIFGRLNFRLYSMSFTKHLHRLALSLIWLLSVYTPVAGQTPYVFRHLNVENGLSNNNVKAILKDSEGFLWIGTDNGLNRYDGYNFKVYQPKEKDSNSLLSNDIGNLQEDASGNLWIRTDMIYCIYNRDKDNFITDIPSYLLTMGIRINGEYKVHIDKKHNLWVIQGQDVFYFDFSHKALKTFRIEDLPEETPKLSVSDDGENLYLLWDSILLKIENRTKKCERIDNACLPPNPIAGNHDNVYIDHHGGIWVYSDTNEWIFHKRNKKSEWRQIRLHSEITTSSNAIRSILDSSDGRIWIGTDHKGVFIYDYVNDNLINLLNNPVSPTSLASNRINTIYRDDSGVIWLGNFKKGISYYHESFHEFIDTQHQECGDIASILEDKAGNIWLGTDGNGLYIKEKQKGFAIRKLPIPDIAIISLLEDHKGRIWAGSYRDGLFCYDNSSIRHFTPENSKLPHSDIWSMKEDRYGNLWIGCVRETLVCFNPDMNIGTSYLLPGGYGIYALNIFYDHGDKMYIGTTYGLCVMDIMTKIPEMLYTNRKGTQAFKQPFISTVFKDDRDILWLAHKQGLTAWDLKSDSLYRFDVTNGLCDNLIKSIIQDNHRNMWFATSNGLSILEVTQDVGKGLDFSFRNLSTRDGLSENYFNSHSACKLSSGDLLLGGTNGYTFINPNKLTEKSRPLAKVYFTNLTIGNQPIEVDSIYEGRKLLTSVLNKATSLSLRHDDNLISIEFAAGDLLNADKIRYAYKLEGLNTQWYYTNENKVVFTTLPPGSYKLLIKVCNSDGIWNDEATGLSITVSPPIYLCNGAIALYILLTIGIISYVIYRFRKHHHTRLEQQREKMEQEQKLILNEMKLKFFTNISHDLRTPLTLIISPLQMLLSETVDEGICKKLNIINNNAQQLLTLINSLLDFRKLDVGAETLRYKSGDIVCFIREVCTTFQEYALDHTICFSFMCEVESLNISFDPVKMQKVMNNLLSNAFKYTPDKGEINVHLYCEDENVCICVADNGQGIADKDKKHIFERFYQLPQTQEKTGSGIGLHIANEYVLLHKGTISVTNNFPKGSVFTVKLPIVTDTGEKEEPLPEALSGDKVPDEPSAPALEEARYTILLVDDNKDFCSFMSEFLSGEYAIRTAYNGAEALKVLEENNINIVVSDIMMPVMNGTELCRQIKTNMQWSHIPVILLTARMAEEYRTEGFEQGADDYIVKPFDFNLLKLRIKKLIEWTERCHRKFSLKMEVAPNEITITPLDEQFIGKAIKIVEERMSDSDFSVEMLGAELGLSRSHLYKKLMCITGKGPADFIRIIRLKRSKQLLEKSQKQIAEIAYEVGFNSPKRFTINFKNEFGISPSDYIRSLK